MSRSAFHPWRRLALAGFAFSALACHGTRLVKVPETVDTFKQGASNQSVLSFTQKPALVDVLFVVRNGPYMCEKQTQLAGKFQTFITALQQQNLDFHVAVVTTDFTSAQFQGKFVAATGMPLVLDGGTPNLVSDFGANVLAVGSSGSANSQGLLAGLAAVTAPLNAGANAGFLRPNASLAIIVVSDEDDFSFDPPPPSPDYFVTFFVRSFAELKGAGNEDLVSVSAIVGADDAGNPVDCTGAGGTVAGCIFPDSTGHAGVRYAAVAAGTGGLVQSICASDFGPLLTTLASHIGGLTRSYTLASAPLGEALDPSTLTVTVTPVNGPAYTVPQDPNNGWSYDGVNGVVLFNGSGVPPPQSQVTISYALLQRAFPLTHTPQTATIEVVVIANGLSTSVFPTTTDPNTGWSYDNTSNSIVFAPNSIPPVGAEIDVSYRF
jgi:hypothetical protein